MFTSAEYCSSICPLFEAAHEELPPRCIADCLYDQESRAIHPAPPKRVSRRSYIPLFVRRDPRVDHNFQPILPWMYGHITGRPSADFAGF
jgi:hypothetical protein